MDEDWSYDDVKRISKNGIRWHFVRCHSLDESLQYEDRPFKLYFRNDQNTVFGLLKFPKIKDNPYRNYDVMINKIMNNELFRQTLICPEAEIKWLKNWR